VVADDAPHMRRLLLAALRQFGFLPIDAANLREGLEPGGGAARIDLVVADLVLPQVSGTEMVRRWRLKQPRLKAVCLRANASALSDVHLHKPLSLNGVCDGLASLHHDVAARRALRRRYSMAFGEVSNELRAQASDLFAWLAPQSDGEMNSTNTVILIFAELPRDDDPFDREMGRRRETANVEDVPRITETWQFVRPESPEGLI
jgi:CheY-like chemotaxis protein